MRVQTYRRLSVGVLVYTIAAILWGAFVRASASGDGCGDHWPLCKGEVLPSVQQLKTVIEFTHRATTGILSFAVIAMTLLAFRVFPRKHIVRRAAVTSLAGLVLEAAAGAMLVKFRLVAGNQSPMRGVAVSVHLVVTFFLLATITLTAFWAHGDASPKWRGQGTLRWVLGLGLGGLTLLGITGAITALGDSLFPAASLAEGMKQDLSDSAHIFIRLRMWHPLIALLVGSYVTAASIIVAGMRPTQTVKRFAYALMTLFILQLGAGAANIVLLAPIWMQLVHLLLADCVWISFIMMTAGALHEGVLTEAANAVPEPLPAQ